MYPLIHRVRVFPYYWYISERGTSLLLTEQTTNDGSNDDWVFHDPGTGTLAEDILFGEGYVRIRQGGITGHVNPQSLIRIWKTVWPMTKKTPIITENRDEVIRVQKKVTDLTIKRSSHFNVWEESTAVSDKEKRVLTKRRYKTKITYFDNQYDVYSFKESIDSYGYHQVILYIFLFKRICKKKTFVFCQN